MSLPKIKSPTFSLKLPSTGQKIVYRPFTVKEEKVLLLAEKGDSTEDQVRSIKQVLTNCIIEPGEIDIDKLASFDIEYLFLKLRSKSVGEIVELKISPQEREGLPPQKVKINLDEIDIGTIKAGSNIVDIGDDIKIEFKYPTLDMVMHSDELDEDDPIAIFKATMKTVFYGEDAYEVKDQTEEELNEFLESMQNKQLNKIQEFFEGLPKIQKTVHYKWVNPEDKRDIHEEDITITGLLNFLS